MKALGTRDRRKEEQRNPHTSTEDKPKARKKNARNTKRTEEFPKTSETKTAEQDRNESEKTEPEEIQMKSTSRGPRKNAMRTKKKKARPVSRLPRRFLHEQSKPP